MPLSILIFYVNKINIGINKLDQCSCPQGAYILAELDDFTDFEAT